MGGYISASWPVTANASQLEKEAAAAPRPGRCHRFCRRLVRRLAGLGGSALRLRSQLLLQRQLVLLDSMEQRAEEPDQPGWWLRQKHSGKHAAGSAREDVASTGQEG